MPSYNRNRRGYDFEPGTPRQPVDEQRRRNDNMEFMDPNEARRAASMVGREIDFDDDLEDFGSTDRRRGYDRRRDDDDQFDNYRPGTMMGMSFGEEQTKNEPQPFKRRSARINDDFGAQFEDDFDDEIIPRRREAPPTIENYRPPRRGYSRANNYGEDYDEEAFRREFGGIRGLGVRQRQLSDEEQLELRRRERREREMIQSDGYRGGREMMVDRAYDGSVGVPEIFAQYFREGYEPERRVVINGGRSSYVRRRANKTAMTAVAAVLALVAVVGAVLFISTSRVSKPLNVATALTSMDADTSMRLIKNTVDNTLSSMSVTVSYTGAAGQSGSGTFYYSDCGFEYTDNADGTVEYIETDNGDGTRSNHTYTTIGSIRFDETLVIDFLNDLVGEDGEPMIEPSHEVKVNLDPKTWEYSGEIVVRAGSDGYGIDYDKFIVQAMECVSSGKFDPISMELQVTRTSDISVENIHDAVYKEAADAFSVTDGLGNVTYTEHVIGQDFDESRLQQIINGANETEWTMPITLTMPKMTIQELRADECPDLLATYYTEFNAGNVGRTSNIQKCCEYINNYYKDNPMQPGDEFSFNTVVGERTAERGFSKATVYSSEGTDEDYGGGICQVSSTLYYTTILANLETVSRRNHLYTVGYMTNQNREQRFANDATVNWGTCDYKFRNSKQYPIRPELIVSGNTLTCNIWGTWDGFTADFGYDETATEYYQTVYHRANPGKSNQAGQMGRTIDAYRIIYYNGEEYDRYFENTSTYIPLTQVKYTNDLPAGKEYDVYY